MCLICYVNTYQGEAELQPSVMRNRITHPSKFWVQSLWGQSVCDEWSKADGGSGDADDVGFSTSACIELGSSDYISMWWYHTAIAGNMLSVQSWFSGFRLD